MRFPDWLIYILVLAALIFGLSKIGERAPAPDAPQTHTYSGPLLPSASTLDTEVLVEVGPVSEGAGTAFPVSADGWWLTARHVVDSCPHLGIQVGGGSAIQVLQMRTAEGADLALIKTFRGPAPLGLNFAESKMRVGQIAYHFGFPQGVPGEAASRLIGRERLLARGRYHIDEPILAWAEVGRSHNRRGSLAGISGGPAFNAEGQVIGVTLAESVRRGRLYTAAPETILAFLKLAKINANGQPVAALTPQNYGLQNDKLRQALRVAQVVCTTKTR